MFSDNPFHFDIANTEVQQNKIIPHILSVILFNLYLVLRSPIPSPIHILNCVPSSKFNPHDTCILPMDSIAHSMITCSLKLEKRFLQRMDETQPF